MNKQKLIEKYEEKYETIFGFPVIQLDQILEDLKQLDEPQKVVLSEEEAKLGLTATQSRSRSGIE